MSDNFMEKISSFGERLKIGGAEVSRKVSFKMKEFFQGHHMVDQIVEEATNETLDEPDLSINLEICDMVNHERVNSIEIIRGIKKRVTMSNHRVQYLAMVLLESLVSNCERAFSGIAAERVLEEMVKVIDDPRTIVNNQNKALMLIENWGERQLHFLPVFGDTYKRLKSRGVRFPGHDDESLARICTPARSVSASNSTTIDIGQQVHRDISAQTFSATQVKEAFDVARNSIELLTTVLSSSPQQEALVDEVTTTLVQQCSMSRNTVQKIIETSSDNDALLFEALNLNDEIQNILSKYMDMKKPQVVSLGGIVYHESENVHNSNKEQTSKDNLISF